MGAYLSEPIVEKHSADEKGEHMSYGASSMQGWRVNQEDAHNHLLNFDGGKSLFAVYDGHGGHEVAEYCSRYLPDYIKKNENYKCGNYEKALEDSFIGFDAILVDRKVVAELKVIAGSTEDEKEDEEEEVDHLCKEASMPIEQVIAKYNGESNGDENSGEPCKPLMNPALAGLRCTDNSKPISPFLRAKSSSVGEGSSGLNKHIRFNESGEEEKEQVKTKEEINGVVKGEVKENGSSSEHTPTTNITTKTETKTEIVNGTSDTSSEDNKAADTNSTEEKENKDTNGVVSASIKQSGTEMIVTDIKGKGKGKGKGKSSMVKSSSMIIEASGEDILNTQNNKEKKKRTAKEIYDSLQKEHPESDDEVSEDSEDQEFGAESDDSDSDDEEGEEDLEEEDDEEEEEDSEMEDEEDEEGVIEADFTEEPGNDSGCTAVVAMIAGSKLYVANAGDSRCVVCRDGKAYEMSFDHKPEDEIELNRIHEAGGKVTPDGRVNGGLNLSRAIGDHAYKQNKTKALKDQMISSQPDIKVLDLDPAKDSWMILACDGIWNFMTSEEVVEFINPKMEKTPEDKLSGICEELFDACLAPTTEGDGTGCDNMTAVIIKFKPSLATCKDVIQTNGEPASSSSGSSLSTSTQGPQASATSSGSSSGTSSKTSAEAADSSSQDEANSSQEETAEPKPKRVKLDN